MTPRAGGWLACGALAALAACLNPLTDDTPSRSGSAGVVPGPEGDSPDHDGEMAGQPQAPPNFQGAGESPAPAEEDPRPGEETPSRAPSTPDAGATDAGPLRAAAANTQRDLARDAGASGSSP